jgi:(heptosyl)LPS beta-1,4-glucosyltransferase
MGSISVVINTLNESRALPKAIASIKSLADEIVVCDMQSDDDTAEVAKTLGAVVYSHKRLDYVEPARNYAISKAKGDWILVLDVDEEIPTKLVKRLKEIAKKSEVDYCRLPRKNTIFGKWMKHTGWWPDYNIRFFKKGRVSWNEVIHAVPMTTGRGTDLPAEEELAIIHDNYASIGEYLERMNRYTTVQSRNLLDSGYRFIWKDLINKPFSELLSRFFTLEGYKDGVHGLALSLLQAFSQVVLYIKVWEQEKYLEQAVSFGEINKEIAKNKKELDWWILDALIKTKNIVASIPLRIKRKIIRSRYDRK